MHNVPLTRQEALALLEWQIAMGADEAIGEIARDRLSPALAADLADLSPVSPVPDSFPLGPPPNPPPLAGERRVGVLPAQPEKDRARDASAPSAVAPTLLAPPAALAESPAEAAQSARLLAAGAETIEALAELVANFDLCPLKRTATNTVFMDGNPEARIVIVGEAPGAEEDRTGRPFVGRAGQLLDRMLAAIDLDRTQVQITNVIYWRPPGNRKPTAAETAACLPFVLRHIALALLPSVWGGWQAGPLGFTARAGYARALASSGHAHHHGDGHSPIVDPMNSVVSRKAPSTVHCSSEPAATAPNRKSTHHCACSKKKFGCREKRKSPVCRKRVAGSRPAAISAALCRWNSHCC